MRFFKKPKIRFSDFIFMILMCIALYFVYKREFNQIIAQKQEKKIKAQAFDKLQTECINGDKKACEQINMDFMKAP